LEVSVYFDANILVSVIVLDAMSAGAEAALRRHAERAVVSDFCIAEVASAIGKRVRTGAMSVSDGTSVLAAFDAWVEGSAKRLQLTSRDIAVCQGWALQSSASISNSSPAQKSLGWRSRALSPRI
jgi:urease accessory protein UreF